MMGEGCVSVQQDCQCSKIVSAARLSVQQDCQCSKIVSAARLSVQQDCQCSKIVSAALFEASTVFRAVHFANQIRGVFRQWAWAAE